MSRHAANLAFEGLESKILLAGNVTVVASATAIKITGDEQSNQISIVRLDDDTMRVDGTGTTINGAAGQEFAYQEFMSIKLDFSQGGNDNVRTDSPTEDILFKSFKGKFGDGNDVLDLRATKVFKLGLAMGEGNNSFLTSNRSAFIGAKVSMGGGADVITMEGGLREALAKFSLKTGAGSDNVSIQGFTGGVGIGRMKAALGDDADTFFAANNVITFKATVDGGDGADSTDGSGNTFQLPGGPLVNNVETRAGQW